MATVVEVTGATYPQSRNDKAILPLEGVSLVPAFAGEKWKRSAPLFLEHENNASVRDGDWKLVGAGVAAARGVQKKKWELYDLAKDGTELHDLAKSQPEKVEALSQQWYAWARRVGVYPKPSKK